MLGHHRSWAYQMRKKGLIKTIKGLGRELVSAEEVERILNGGQSND